VSRQERLIAAALGAIDACVAQVGQRYRVAPFATDGGEYPHIIRVPRAGQVQPSVTLCRSLATLRFQDLRPLRLGQVECLECLVAFTREVAPTESQQVGRSIRHASGAQVPLVLVLQERAW